MGEITLEIDGKELKVEEGTTILEAAKSVGIYIPTLCYHPALLPFGACRLCSVEITSRDGTRIVTACNYPVEEGLVVNTDSPNVLDTRKMIIELMLSRCPNVKIIQDLAQEYGVGKPRFKLEDEKCILCGLCTRICEERMGVSAINFVGRGVDRKIETPFQRTLDISLDVCMACGACAFVCPTGAIKLEDITRKKPVPILSEFDMGLTSRAPIYVPFPQSVPNVPVIDTEKCVHFLTGKCKICEVFCEADAIDFEQEEEIIELNVGAIIVAAGFDPFDPTKKPELGYGRYPNVITGLEFERLSSASGPTMGKIEINGKEPKDVVFIHCVGSRDASVGNEYCSRVCCMYLAKQAHLVKEKLPEANVTVFYMDVRAYGKGFEEFYDRVREEGINYRRGNPSEVYKRGDRLVVRAEDTLLGQPIEVEADLVVLGVGMVPREATAQMANFMKLSRSADGFLLEVHPKLRPLDTATEGIFLAGTCQGPKDIPDTVAQASGAAAKALALISRGKVRLEAITSSVDEEICGGCGTCVSICPFGAITLRTEDTRRIATVTTAQCKGCGSCGVTCPSGAISIRHFKDQQILAQIEALTEKLATV